MKQSQSWLLQAESDWTAAEILARQAVKRPNLRCQVMAKYQQVAEKSIKAMVAAVNELGTANFMTITPKHVPADEIKALSGLKRYIDNTSVDYLKSKVLKEKQSEQILALCRLAPEYPKEGEPAHRNTEYPFHVPGATLDDWTVPAVPDIFTETAIKAARELVWILRGHVEKFVSTVRRGPQ